MTEPIPQSGANLRLRIHLAKSIYRDEEPITCRFVLRNEGHEAVLLNQRMLLDLRLAESEVYFVIKDRTGHEYAYRYVIIPRRVVADDFKPLRPGEELAIKYDLRELFGLPKGHAFTAQAGYRNRFPHPDPNVEAWLGDVLSNTIELYTQ